MSTTTMSSSPEIIPSPTQPSSKYHAGNVPTLPQTKCCTLCPAKFTRTTHLNRHLRSHTNERLYHCNTCDSQFTRSDLLARHKRTCGDPNANRSRRKSCQACAASKIKCNLEWPCSKCTSRGRECVFINDPRISRSKKAAAARRASASSSANTSDAGSDYYQTPSPQVEVPPNSPSHLCGVEHGTDALGLEFPLHLSLAETSYAAFARAQAQTTSNSYFPTMPSTSSLPSLSSSPTTTASSPSPTLDPFEGQFAEFSPYGSPDHVALHDQLAKMFPTDVLDSVFDQNAYGLTGASEHNGYMMMDQNVAPVDDFSFLSESLESAQAYPQQTSAQYATSYTDPNSLYHQLAALPRADANSVASPTTGTQQWSHQVPMNASSNDPNAMLWNF